MKTLFFKCGCGCVVLPITDPATVTDPTEFRYVMIDACDSDPRSNWGFPNFGLGKGHIRLNSIQEGEWVSNERMEAICDAINHKVHNGHKFEEVQNLLGVKRER